MPIFAQVKKRTSPPKIMLDKELGEHKVSCKKITFLYLLLNTLDMQSKSQVKYFHYYIEAISYVLIQFSVEFPRSLIMYH